MNSNVELLLIIRRTGTKLTCEAEAVLCQPGRTGQGSASTSFFPACFSNLGKERGFFLNFEKSSEILFFKRVDKRMFSVLLRCNSGQLMS